MIEKESFCGRSLTHNTLLQCLEFLMSIHITAFVTCDLALHDMEKYSNQNLNPIMTKAIVTPYITPSDFTGTCPTYARFTNQLLKAFPCLFSTTCIWGFQVFPQIKGMSEMSLHWKLL